MNGCLPISVMGHLQKSRSFIIQATALAAISAAILCYEVALTRVIAIQHWHHLSPAIVAIALLGFGVSSTVLTLFNQQFRNHSAIWFIAFPALTILFVPLCIRFSHSIPFNMLALSWEKHQLVYLLLYSVCFLIPFLPAAGFITLRFSISHRKFGKFYAADLFGAATGIAVALLCLDAGSVSLAIVASMLLSTLALALSVNGFRQFTGFISLSLVWLVMSWQSDWLSVLPNEFKQLPVQLKEENARDRYENDSSQSRLTLVSSSGQHSAPGLSINSVIPAPRQWHLFFDGDSAEPLVHSLLTNTGDNVFEQSIYQAPYLLTNQAPEVLLLNGNYSWHAWTAERNDASGITLVTDNADFAEVLKLNELSQDGAFLPSAVSIVHTESRRFLAKSSQQYDIILTSAETVSVGGAAQRISYELTVEALSEYFNRLTDRGILAIGVRQSAIPREQFKLASSLIRVLRNNQREPAAHLAVIRDWQTSLLLVSKSAIPKDATNHIREWAKQWAFDLDALPGIKEPETNQYHIKPENQIYQGIQALLQPAQSFSENYVYDLQPATDYQPFFHQFFRWETLPYLRNSLGPQWPRHVGWGYLLSVGTLGVLACLAVSLILLPLVRTPLPHRNNLQITGFISYFTAISLAYMLLEILFLQLFRRLLDTATLTFSIVVLGMLIGTGVGSVYSHKITEKFRLVLVTLYVCFAALLIWSGFELIYTLTLNWPKPGLILLVLVMVLIPATGMGVYLPYGISGIEKNSPGAVAWAWAISAFASVTGALLAPLIAIHFGFAVLLSLVLFGYIAATLIVPTCHDETRAST